MSQTISTQITIQAPLEKVWQILDDFEQYHTWNEFCPKIESSKIIGEPLVMTVYMKPHKKPIRQKEIFSEYHR